VTSTLPSALDVLAFIVTYKQAHDGNSPTVREIRKHFAMRSTCTVVTRLNELERLQLITRPRETARAIQIAKGGRYVYEGGTA
jgi:SOS-response transcriptional repressor LexA